MSYSWKNFKIKRFYGLDLKTNPLDVRDGVSLDCENVFQDKHGVVSKRKGNAIMFDADETATSEIDEIGSATLSGTKYYFEFVGGSFKYSTSLTGSKTSISSAYTSGNVVWWAVLDNKVFWVDNDNPLRFFDPAISTTAFFDSDVYERPNPAVIPTSSGGAGFDYTFTVEKGYSATVTSAESPAWGSSVAGASAATITIDDDIGNGNVIAVGDRIRVYSKANTTVTSYKNVTPLSGAHANGVFETGDDGGGYLRVTSTAASYAIVTVAINDDQPNLYTDLGVAINKTAPEGLTGLTVHYGRLVGWMDDSFFNSKSSNPHSWPDDAANQEAFVYTVGEGDGEEFQRLISYQESLYAFKQTQIFVFGGVGPSDTGDNAYAFRRLETNGIGCIAPKSVVVVGEERANYLVFLSKQGFYATDGTSPSRIGETIETQIIGLSDSILSSSVGFYHKRDGAYICFVGSSTSRIGWFLDTRKDEGVLVGWFKFSGLPVKSIYWDNDRYIFGTYQGYAASERIAGLSSDFSDIRINYLAAASIDTAADTFTFSSAHGFSTQDSVVVRTNGTIPAGLTANTTVFVIKVSDTVIKLATTAANASLGTAIDITSQGTGTHSVVGSKAIDSFYTTNWINFGSTSLLKKIGKSSVSFDATAQSISLDIGLFYDWVNTVANTLSITIASSNSWGSGLWGSFVWGAGAVAVPKNLALPRRKIRSIRFKFENDELNQDFNLQSLEIPFDAIRNRDNFA